MFRTAKIFAAILALTASCFGATEVKYWGTNVMPVEARPPGADSSVPARGPSSNVQRAQHSRSFDQTLRLQVGLDRLGFSPGCIDGRWGSQTTEALRAWQRQQGLGETGAWNEDVSNAFAAVSGYLTPYVVSSGDLEGLTAIPQSWVERAKLPAMAHETVRERLAEKFHAKESLLEQLNPQAGWPNPESGTVIVAPGVESRAVRLPRAAKLVINLDRKFIEAFDANDKVMFHFPCSIARKVEKRPRGELKVITAAPNPNYTFDPALFAEDPEAAAIPSKLIIPPGPNNPVGVAWIGLNLTGYGMHGTPRPEDIGRTESHGCFRLHNWNAARLVRVVYESMPVQMIRSDE